MKYFKNRIYVTKIMHISMPHGASQKNFHSPKEKSGLKVHWTFDTPISFISEKNADFTHNSKKKNCVRDNN